MGYHTIETVFQALELHDELVVEATSGGIQLGGTRPSRAGECRESRGPSRQASGRGDRSTAARGSKALQEDTHSRRSGRRGALIAQPCSWQRASCSTWTSRTSGFPNWLARWALTCRSFLTGGTAVAEGIGELLTPVRVALGLRGAARQSGAFRCPLEVSMRSFPGP